MHQSSFNFDLTDFEQATADQLVSYRIGRRKNESDESVGLRIEEMVNSEKLKLQVKVMVHRWNKTRMKLGLGPFK